MFKARSFLFWRGLNIAVMGIELMVKGLASPAWAHRSGFAVAATIAVVTVRPTVEARPAVRRLPSVQVVTAQPRRVRLSVEAQGSVVPRTESDLVAEVSGRIVWVSPSLASGGFLRRNEVLVRIDSGDYEVAVERAEVALERAQSELDLAQAKLARRESLAHRNVASPAASERSQ